MPLSVSCQSCGRQLRLRDSLAGKTVACPDCNAAIKVRATGETKPAKGTGSGRSKSSSASRSAERPRARSKPKRKATRKTKRDDYEDDWDLVDAAPKSAMPSRSSSRRKRKPCPACAEMIVASAAVCRFCGEDFRRKRGPTRSRKRDRNTDDQMSGIDAVMVVLCPGIGFLFAIIYLVQGKPKGAKLLVAIFALWGILILMATIVNSMG